MEYKTLQTFFLRDVDSVCSFIYDLQQLLAMPYLAVRYLINPSFAAWHTHYSVLKLFTGFDNAALIAW